MQSRCSRPARPWPKQSHASDIQGILTMHVISHDAASASAKAKPHRTFKVTSPHMQGDDVAEFQKTLKAQFDTWQVNYPLQIDGDYGVATRSACASVCHGLGMLASRAMQGGVTPALRSKIRNKDLTDAERARFHERGPYRRALRDKFKGGGVCSPLVKIITHSNGFSAGHDGVDLICPPDAPGFAICNAKVVRADAGGWWGKGAPQDPQVRAKGDGIVILQSLVDIGPIKKGMLLCYGHAEDATVKKGQIVHAGDRICRAGFARAFHFHWMVNSGAARFWDGDRPLGIGDRDPWPIVKYAIDHA
jgi:murein DD-endopeptidase MepM/ murein hydrolase activator NlpD